MVGILSRFLLGCWTASFQGRHLSFREGSCKLLETFTHEKVTNWITWISKSNEFLQRILGTKPSSIEPSFHLEVYIYEAKPPSIEHPFRCWSNINPAKFTWNPKIEFWKMIFLFNYNRWFLGSMLIFWGVYTFKSKKKAAFLHSPWSSFRMVASNFICVTNKLTERTETRSTWIHYLLFFGC